jgi:hypothetical protein
LLILALHLITNAGYRYWILSKSALDAKYKSYFDQKPMPDFLFIGDSHFQNGINPAYIPGSFNLATSAENYILNYYRIKHLLQHTSYKPTHIFLSVGLHSFSGLNEELLIERQLDDIYWSQFVDFKELWQISGNAAYLKLYLKSNLFSYGGKYSTVGKLLGNIQPYQEACKGFISSSDVILNQPNWAVNARHRVWYQLKSAPLISNTMLVYFNKIKELCKQYNIRLIFVKMPLSGPYIEQLKSIDLDQEAFWKAIGISDGVVLDFQTTFENQPVYFSDADHLNETGAGVLSTKILKIMEENKWLKANAKMANFSNIQY